MNGPRSWRTQQRPDPGLRTLVVGAGEAGRTVARDLRRTIEYGLWPVAFLDDDHYLRSVAGLPVAGTIGDLPDVARRERAQAVIIAIPGLPTARIAAIGRVAGGCGLAVRYLPSFVNALERDARLADLRTLDVASLLGRQELHVASPSAQTLIAGGRVLVTGAGGSIGSELCRQIGGYQPAALFLLDHDESNLHRLQLEVTGSGLLDSDEIIIADIRDRARIGQVIAAVRPDVVFHAAAHKHLPLLERHPCEGVKSNVLGTQILVDAARAHGVQRFVLISTDKAADPTSVLGATKRLAELVVRSGADGPMDCGSVRFGNVLGSRGSFLSILAEQVAQGGPVTVTHPDVTRFFMTVEEAVGLVLEAATMVEDGETFVLDMGEPVRIVDLVTSYVDQLHLPVPTIRFTGLRPGEKLHEVVFSARESRLRTAHPKIWATRISGDPARLYLLLDTLYAAADDNDCERVRELLHRLLPEYTISRRREPLAAVSAPYPDGF
ncbi:MAG TPA: nucleoside-diphosphate sugar epimerase/dehydratase [Kineosporiaceae bacterium]